MIHTVKQGDRIAQLVLERVRTPHPLSPTHSPPPLPNKTIIFLPLPLPNPHTLI